MLFNIKPRTLSLEEYLEHRYQRPGEMLDLPMADEAFVVEWTKGAELSVQELLQQVLELSWDNFVWQRPEVMELSFTDTLGGRLPVISLQDHADLCAMVSLLRGDREPQNYLPSVNACALKLKQGRLEGHRVLVLNRAPYSNVPASALGLEEADWLEKSQQLRLRHEAAHYECLRLLGGMRNHLRDEIVADTLGQLAAFGSFSAQRQRLFFGLEKGKDFCTGRLQHYCSRLTEEDRGRLYLYTDQLLDELEGQIAQWQQQAVPETEIFLRLACDEHAGPVVGAIW